MLPAAEDTTIEDTTLPRSQAQEVAYVETLEGKFRWLRFPAALEHSYRNHDAAERLGLPVIAFDITRGEGGAVAVARPTWS